MKIFKAIFNLPSREEGQTMIEYVLVILLISLVLVFAFHESSPADAVGAASQIIVDIITNALS